MVWKTSEGHFLIQGKMTRIPFIHGGVGLADGERFHDSAVYYEISSSGKVVNKYGEPLPFSIEDEMTVSNIHLVIGDALYRFYWSQLYRYESRFEIEMLLRNLQVYNSLLPFDTDAVIREYGLRIFMAP
jgi:hypothetical protein